jgi:hypothetical protein
VGGTKDVGVGVTLGQEYMMEPKRKMIKEKAGQKRHSYQREDGGCTNELEEAREKATFEKK